MGSHEGLLGFHIWGLWEVHGGPFVRHCGKPFGRPFMHYFDAWKFCSVKFCDTSVYTYNYKGNSLSDVNDWCRPSSPMTLFEQKILCRKLLVFVLPSGFNVYFGYKFILKSEELQCGVAEVSNPTSADTKWYIHHIPCNPYTQYTIYPVPHIHNR